MNTRSQDPVVSEGWHRYRGIFEAQHNYVDLNKPCKYRIYLQAKITNPVLDMLYMSALRYPEGTPAVLSIKELDVKTV